MKPRLLIPLSLLLAAGCAAAPSDVATAPLTVTLPATHTALPSVTTTALAAPSAITTQTPTATPFFGQVVIPQATVRYYRVEGATAADLRRCHLPHG